MTTEQVVEAIAREMLDMPALSIRIGRGEISTTRVKKETSRLARLALSITHDDDPEIARFGRLIYEYRQKIVALSKAKKLSEKQRISDEIDEIIRDLGSVYRNLVKRLHDEGVTV